MLNSLVILVGLIARSGLFPVWPASAPLFTEAVGGSAIITVLGIVFSPFATLVYVVAGEPGPAPHRRQELDADDVTPGRRDALRMRELVIGGSWTG